MKIFHGEWLDGIARRDQEIERLERECDKLRQRIAELEIDLASYPGPGWTRINPNPLGYVVLEETKEEEV